MTAAVMKEPDTLGMAENWEGAVGALNIFAVASEMAASDIVS